MATKISLIVPLYNEEENIAPLVAACKAALAPWPECELLLVDDGSTDSTPQRLRSLCERSSPAHESSDNRAPSESSDCHDLVIRGISLRRRFGKGAALSAGFAEAEGEWIATLDADLQEDPAELRRLVEVLENEDADLVTGWRRQRRDSWIKCLSSRLFNCCVRWSTRLPIHDINCGFKLMRREFADELTLTGGRFRFVPLLAHWWGFRWREAEVSHRPRRHGRSSYGLDRFPGVFVDLFALACLIRYHARPGHVFIQAGTLSLLSGGGICSYLAALWFRYGTIQWRYPLLALGVLLVAVGVQLVATGILGEWLAYRHRSEEPGYRVRRRFGTTVDDTEQGATRGRSLRDGSRDEGAGHRDPQGRDPQRRDPQGRDPQRRAPR